MKLEELMDILRTPDSTAHEMRRSLRLAEAVAEDHRNFFCVEAKGMEGTKLPRKRDLKPGVFIRATTFNLGYNYNFLSLKDAEAVEEATKKSIVKYRERPRIKEAVTDFGLIEAISNLEERGCKLEKTLKVAERVLLNIKYGL